MQTHDGRVPRCGGSRRPSEAHGRIRGARGNGGNVGLVGESTLFFFFCSLIAFKIGQIRAFAGTSLIKGSLAEAFPRRRQTPLAYARPF
jgi:hypothetical protein